ncbi:Ferroporti-1 [Pholiota molesta]|nr:Ferroporti-1 [Pholiota molesta]
MTFATPSDEDHASPSERDPLLKRLWEEDEQIKRPGTQCPRASRADSTYHTSCQHGTRASSNSAPCSTCTIYPATLLPMSVYAFARSLSAIVFASAVGQYIDTGNRLQVVRLSIVVQRIVAAASCIIFYLTVRMPLGHGGKTGMLVLLAFLACIEKLCSIMNMVSVERDWVVVDLNAQMRRIDLFCKLLGPLFIAFIDSVSTEIAIIVTFAMNIASVLVEYLAIAQPKEKLRLEHPDAGSSQEPESRWMHNWHRIRQVMKKSTTDFNMYFHHRAFLPSIACALLYLTVLNFAGQMVTYLLSAGYTSTQIGLARTLSIVFEMLATWVAPWLMGKIGPVRAGLWFSSWQSMMLVAGVAVFLRFHDNKLVSASGLVGGTILSRVGLRGFDLCTQLIVQEDVEADARSAFSSIEAAWQNALNFSSAYTLYVR